MDGETGLIGRSRAAWRMACEGDPSGFMLST